ncbi:hypothetical protein N9L02_00645 [Gammaproteobacteria bacterium]|nr:hypothetical protein [Gammaproteobacteria bacterium]
MTNKTVFPILGFGRSGTSLVARGVNILGINLGNNLMPSDETWNPTGYWESLDAVAINEELFKTFNCRWDTLSINFSNSHAQLKSCNNKISNLLKKELINNNSWAFKDTRTARLLPMWQEQFKKLNIDDKYIIVIRNPLSAATSFNKLVGLGIERGILLWMMYLVSAIQYTNNKKRIIISYENLIQNPIKELYRINNFFKISASLDNNAIEDYTNNFLARNLIHHNKSYNDFIVSSTTPKPSIRFYDLLNKLSKDEINFDSPEFVFDFNIILNFINDIEPMLKYIDNLTNKRILYEVKP